MTDTPTPTPEKPKSKRNRNWLLQLFLFSLVTCALSFLLAAGSKLCKKYWTEQLAEEPLPAVTELAINHGGALPWYIFFACLTLLACTQSPLLKRMPSLKLHIILIAAYAQALFCTFAAVGYALPMVKIGHDFAEEPATAVTSEMPEEATTSTLQYEVSDDYCTQKISIEGEQVKIIYTTHSKPDALADGLILMKSLCEIGKKIDKAYVRKTTEKDLGDAGTEFTFHFAEEVPSVQIGTFENISNDRSKYLDIKMLEETISPLFNKQK